MAIKLLAKSPTNGDPSMNKYLERLRNDFQGNADALITKSQEVVKTLSLEQEAGEGNERLLRHYVSIGVVDKPSREGRDAHYGFRHLVQFVAARRLLAEGFPLAKIAKYTAVVPTDAQTSYLEKPDRTSEAELLVAAFRTEASSRSSPAQSPRRTVTTKPMSNVATGMGMVDVMHEMREMEQRVHNQLKDLQSRVLDMMDDAMRGMGSQVQVQRLDPVELKVAVSKLADLMEETTHRFDRMLQKPMIMIEKQMDQQRYLFDEAHKQKDFLKHMFNDLLDKQRRELLQFFSDQTRRLNESLENQQRFYNHVDSRLDNIEAAMSYRLMTLEKHMEDLQTLPHSTKLKKEGAV
jgi:DNA-binding transcriptional MerR regulator